MLRAPSFVVAAAMFVVSAPSVSAQERVALVIGNAGYAGDAVLRNPVNDAHAIAAALTKLNFKVVKKTDLSLTQFEDAVVEFRKSLKKGSVGLFFYAGHGVQVKGENFLVPLDAKLQEEFQVKEKCYKVDQVLAAMEDSQAALKIVILDSCRDNPFTRSWTRSLGEAGNQGLASIPNVPDGTIIAFSTAPGKTAADGRGQNSPFTKHLVAGLTSRPPEGLEVTDLFKIAGRAVFKEVGQKPWLNQDTSLDEYYLWRDLTTSAAPTVPKATVSGSAQTHLEDYPGLDPTSPIPTPPVKPIGSQPKTGPRPQSPPQIPPAERILVLDNDIAGSRTEIANLKAKIAKEETVQADDQKEIKRINTALADQMWADGKPLIERAERERWITVRDQLKSKGKSLEKLSSDLEAAERSLRFKQNERLKLGAGDR